MYAIIEDGGRQFKVSEGEELQIDFRDTEPGQQITFDRVLAVRSDDDISIGQPTVDGATVSAEVLGEAQGPKLVVQKFRRRKNSRAKTGHRQPYTLVKVNKVALG
jgi:large subunit ribosomal protein L21